MINLLVATIFTILLMINMSYFARDIRHPTNLYIISWLLMFLLLAIPLVNYIAVSNYVYFYVILSAIIFAMSGSIGSGIKFKSSKNSNNPHQLVIPEAVLVVVGTLGLIAAIEYYISRFGLNDLLHNANAVRSSDTGGTGALGLLIFLPTVIFVLIAIQAYTRKRISVISAIYLLFVIIYMILLPERTTLMVTIVWSGLSIYSVERANQRPNLQFIRKYGLPIALTFTAFFGFFIFVSQRTQKIRYLDTIEYALNLQTGVPKSVFDPYIYITGNIPALSVYFDNSQIRQFDLTFTPDETGIFFRRIFQVVGSSNNSETNASANAEFTNIPFLFNTYTWLRSPLHDFGILGSLIFIALCGLLSGIAWSLRSSFRSPLAYFIYGWGATCAIFTIFSNKYFGIYTSYAVLIAVLLYTASNVLRMIFSTRRSS